MDPLLKMYSLLKMGILSPGLAMLDFWSVTPSWSQIVGPKGLSQKLAKERRLALPPLLLSIILVG